MGQGLGGEQDPAAYVDLADQLVHGLQFICDAALDTAPVLSKLSISVVVIGRVLWLKNWSTGQASKKALIDLPFQGDRVFGATLDDII